MSRAHIRFGRERGDRIVSCEGDAGDRARRIETRQLATPGSRAVMRCLANVSPELIRWLWLGRIACGKVTLIVGDPGLGKSFATLDIAARVSTGATWPDGRPSISGSVILLSAEDDAADTIRPRLDALGADLSRIHILDGVRSEDSETGEAVERAVTLADTNVLAEAIDSVTDVRLAIVDPISAYLGTADSHKNAEIRSLLAPLAKFAAARGIAVVAVSHLNKGAGSAIYRIMGSLAFTAAARAVWVVAKDKDDETRRLLLPVKNNLATDSGGLAYRIKTHDNAPFVEWEPDPVLVDVSDALASPPGDEEGSFRQEAAKWLTEILARGPMTVKALKHEASGAGFSWRTIERAKSAVGAVARKQEFSGGWWCWELPTMTKIAMKTATHPKVAAFAKKRHRKPVLSRLSAKTAKAHGMAVFTASRRLCRKPAWGCP